MQTTHAHDKAGNAKFSMEQELAQGELTDAMVERKALLQQILAKNDMNMRDDSRMTYNYIVYGGDVSMAAHEILSTHFLYQNTDYNQMCQSGLRTMANELKAQYGLSWSKTWEITREYGVPALKFLALAKSEKAIPNFDVSLPQMQLMQHGVTT